MRLTRRRSRLCEKTGGLRGVRGSRRSEKLKVILKQIVKKHTHHIVRPSYFPPAKQPSAILTSIDGARVYTVSRRRVARAPTIDSVISYNARHVTC